MILYRMVSQAVWELLTILEKKNLVATDKILAQLEVPESISYRDTIALNIGYVFIISYLEIRTKLRTRDFIEKHIPVFVPGVNTIVLKAIIEESEKPARTKDDKKNMLEENDKTKSQNVPMPSCCN